MLLDSMNNVHKLAMYLRIALSKTDEQIRGKSFIERVEQGDKFTVVFSAHVGDTIIDSMYAASKQCEFLDADLPAIKKMAGRDIEFVFEANGARMRVYPGMTNDECRRIFDAAFALRKAEYEASPAGKRHVIEKAERENKARENMKRVLDNLYGGISGALDMLAWVGDYVDAADHIGVDSQFKNVKEILTAAGYSSDVKQHAEFMPEPLRRQSCAQLQSYVDLGGEFKQEWIDPVTRLMVAQMLSSYEQVGACPPILVMFARLYHKAFSKLNKPAV